MLYAKNQTGALVVATDAYKNEKYFCPSCLGPVIVKQGNLKAAHYAHHSHSCHAFSEGETAEHLKGKKLLANWCAQLNWQVQIEAYQIDLRQRPDVLGIHDGKRVAFEFQCAPLSAAEMQRRSSGYLKDGFSYLWVLGRRHYLKHRLTQQIAQFIRWHHNLGFYLIFLDTVYERFEVLYGIQMADLLPVKYMRFFARNLQQLTAFLHTDHYIRFFGVTQNERLKQKQSLLYKCRACDQQIYQAQEACYVNKISFATAAAQSIQTCYYPPVFRKPAFIWKVRALANCTSQKMLRQLAPSQILGTADLFLMPFIDISKVCLLEWERFVNQLENFAFHKNDG
ncbi:competence protein CoiA [Ligilactobacillus salitolerans]|uniref:Competence protein CoiA n=1 Tax=Ligilactobacillus salitolerans TaxID=1808352 RepID=A0A401IVS4_9LACO|nr:competence protein CoiA family protein [Ligilactobacillus salitolerans]GBG95651.1 competence protein CoiA [Ligilactobacillus salitolerans]